MILRRLPALCVALALVWSVGLAAQNDKKRDEAQKKEIQSIIKVVDDVSAGQPGANDLSCDLGARRCLKAQGNKQYVPFTIAFDPSKVTGGTVALYWRVVSKSAAAPPPAAADAARRTTRTRTRTRRSPSTPTRHQLRAGGGRSESDACVALVHRSAGAYDVFVVVKEPTPEKPPKNAPPPKVSVLKHSMDVPDFWNRRVEYRAASSSRSASTRCRRRSRRSSRSIGRTRWA
jgi:hypothetical protein